MEIAINIRKNKDITDTITIEELERCECKIIKIYQNDEDIKDIVMEAASKNNNNDKTIGEVGCRYIAGIREIMKYIPNITVKEIDDMADEGAWKEDCWLDSNGIGIKANIIDFSRLIKKLNIKYNVNLKYLWFNTYTNRNKDKLIRFLRNNVCPIIKMPNLVYKNADHFINAIGYIEDTLGKVYLKMGETYNNYNGYDNYYIDWEDVKSYEFIYI